MPNKAERVNKLEDDSVSMKVVAKWISVIIAILATIYFVIYFGHGGLTQGRLAQFGDFVGGTLNPVLGFLTVGLLVWSIQIQMKELKATREEIAATKVETELSRKAMEKQVEVSMREAKRSQLKDELSDLRVLINEQLVEIQRLMSLELSNDLHELISSQYSTITYGDIMNIENNMCLNLKVDICDCINSAYLRPDDDSDMTFRKELFIFNNILVEIVALISLILKYNELSKSEKLNAFILIYERKAVFFSSAIKSVGFTQYIPGYETFKNLDTKLQSLN